MTATGGANEQFYSYGADVFAVADGTVVSIQDGKPEETPHERLDGSRNRCRTMGATR